ncbi:MAG: hypothetical protein E6Q97_23440 [Desulfurellales bacterium]|nr:MAG: hypothetical protein E6Q97_23440 [Desulfurellales bacterium]
MKDKAMRLAGLLFVATLAQAGQAHAQTAEPAPSAAQAPQPDNSALITPATAGLDTSAEDNNYQRRIRQAITPDEVRLACRAPDGSITINNEIVVCAERDPVSRYRVPSTAESAVINPERESPVERARAVLHAERGAPAGLGADTPEPGSIARGGSGANIIGLAKKIEKILKKEPEE